MNGLKYTIFTIINITILAGIMSYTGYKVAIQNLDLVQIKNETRSAMQIASTAQASVEKVDTKQLESVIKVIVQDEVTKARIAKAEGTAMALSSVVTKLASNPDLLTALTNTEAIKDIAEIVKNPESKALISELSPSNSGSAITDLKDITDRIAKVETSLPEESKKQLAEIEKINSELNSKLVAFNTLLATFESKAIVSNNFNTLSSNIAQEEAKRLASINTLSGVVNTLESKAIVATLSGAINTLSGKVATIDTELTSQGSTIETLLLPAVNGNVVLNQQIFNTASFVTSTNGIFAIPGEGTWIIKYDIYTDGSGVTPTGSMFAIVDDQGVVVEGTERSRAGSSTAGESISAQAVVTVTEARNYYFVGRSVPSGNVTILNGVTGSSTISFVKL